MSLIDYIREKLSELTRVSDTENAGNWQSQMTMARNSSPTSSYGDPTQMSYAEPNMSYAQPQVYGDPTQMSYAPIPAPAPISSQVYWDPTQMSVAPAYNPVVVNPVAQAQVNPNSFPVDNTITLPQQLPEVWAQNIDNSPTALWRAIQWIPLAISSYVDTTAQISDAAVKQVAEWLALDPSFEKLGIVGWWVLKWVFAPVLWWLSLWVQALTNYSNKKEQEQYWAEKLKTIDNDIQLATENRQQVLQDTIRKETEARWLTPSSKDLELQTNYTKTDWLQEYVDWAIKSHKIAMIDTNWVDAKWYGKVLDTFQANKDALDLKFAEYIGKWLTSDEAQKMVFQDLWIDWKDDLWLTKYYFKWVEEQWVKNLIWFGTAPTDILKYIQTKSVWEQNAPWYSDVWSFLASSIWSAGNLVWQQSFSVFTPQEIDILNRGDSITRKSYSIPEWDSNKFAYSLIGAWPEVVWWLIGIIAGNAVWSAIEWATALNLVNTSTKYGKVARTLAALTKWTLASFPEEVIINAWFNVNNVKQYWLDDFTLDLVGWVFDVGLRSSWAVSAWGKITRYLNEWDKAYYQEALDISTKASTIQTEAKALEQSWLDATQARQQATDNFEAREAQIQDATQQGVQSWLDPTTAEKEARKVIGNNKETLSVEEINAIKKFQDAQELKVTKGIINNDLATSDEFNIFIKDMYLNHRANSLLGDKAVKGLTIEEGKARVSQFIDENLSFLKAVAKDKWATIADLVTKDVGKQVNFFLGIAKSGLRKEDGTLIRTLADVIDLPKPKENAIYATLSGADKTSAIYVTTKDISEPWIKASTLSRLANGVDTGITVANKGVADLATTKSNTIYVASINDLEDALNWLSQAEFTATQKNLKGKTIIGGDAKFEWAAISRKKNGKVEVKFEKNTWSKTSFWQKEKSFVVDGDILYLGHQSLKDAQETARITGGALSWKKALADDAFDELAKIRYGEWADDIVRQVDALVVKLWGEITRQEAEQIVNKVARDLETTAFTPTNLADKWAEHNALDELGLTNARNEVFTEAWLTPWAYPAKDPDMSKALFQYTNPRTAEEKAIARAYILWEDISVTAWLLTEKLSWKYIVPDNFSRDFLLGGDNRLRAIADFIKRNPEIEDVEKIVNDVVESSKVKDVNKYDNTTLSMDKNALVLTYVDPIVSPDVTVMLVKAGDTPEVVKPEGNTLLYKEARKYKTADDFLEKYKSQPYWASDYANLVRETDPELDRIYKEREKLLNAWWPDGNYELRTKNTQEEKQREREVWLHPLLDWDLRKIREEAQVIPTPQAIGTQAIKSNIETARAKVQEFVDEYRRVTSGVTDEWKLSDLKKRAQVFVDTFEKYTLPKLFWGDIVEATNKTQYYNVYKLDHKDPKWFEDSLIKLQNGYDAIFKTVEKQSFGEQVSQARKIAKATEWLDAKIAKQTEALDNKITELQQRKIDKESGNVKSKKEYVAENKDNVAKKIEKENKVNKTDLQKQKDTVEKRYDKQIADLEKQKKDLQKWEVSSEPISSTDLFNKNATNEWIWQPWKSSVSPTDKDYVKEEKKKLWLANVIFSADSPKDIKNWSKYIKFLTSNGFSYESIKAAKKKLSKEWFDLFQDYTQYENYADIIDELYSKNTVFTKVDEAQVKVVNENILDLKYNKTKNVAEDTAKIQSEIDKLDADISKKTNSELDNWYEEYKKWLLETNDQIDEKIATIQSDKYAKLAELQAEKDAQIAAIPEDTRPLRQKVSEDGFALTNIDGKPVLLNREQYIQHLMDKLPEWVDLKTLWLDYRALKVPEKNSLIQALEYINNLMVQKQWAYETVIQNFPDMKNFFEIWSAAEGELPKAFVWVSNPETMKMVWDDVTKIVKGRPLTKAELDGIIEKATSNKDLQDIFKEKFDWFTKLHDINPEYLKQIQEGAKELPPLDDFANKIVEATRYDIGGYSVPMKWDTGITMIKAPDAVDWPRILSDATAYELPVTVEDFWNRWNASQIERGISYIDEAEAALKWLELERLKSAANILREQGKTALVNALDWMNLFHGLKGFIASSKFDAKVFQEKLIEFNNRFNDFALPLKDIKFVDYNDAASQAAALVTKMYYDLTKVSTNVSEWFADLVAKSYDKRLKATTKGDSAYITDLSKRAEAVEQNKILDVLNYKAEWNLNLGTVEEVAKLSNETKDKINALLGTNMKENKEFRQILTGLSNFEHDTNYIMKSLSLVNKALGSAPTKFLNLAKTIFGWLSPMAIIGSWLAYGQNVLQAVKRWFVPMVDTLSILRKHSIGTNLWPDAVEWILNAYGKWQWNTPKTWAELSTRGNTWYDNLESIATNILDNPQNFVDYILSPLVKENAFNSVIKSGSLGHVFVSAKEFDEFISKVDPVLREQYLAKVRTQMSTAYWRMSASVAQGFNRYQPTNAVERFTYMLHSYRQMRAMQGFYNFVNNMSTTGKVLSSLASGNRELASKIARNNPYFYNFISNSILTGYYATKALKYKNQDNQSEVSWQDLVWDLFGAVMNLGLNTTGLQMSYPMKYLKSLYWYAGAYLDLQAQNEEAKGKDISEWTFDSNRKSAGTATFSAVYDSMNRFMLAGITVDDLAAALVNSDETAAGNLEAAKNWLYRTGTAGDRWYLDDALPAFNSYFSSNPNAKIKWALMWFNSDEREADVNAWYVWRIAWSLEQLWLVKFKDEAEQARITKDISSFLLWNFSLYKIVNSIGDNSKKIISSETQRKLEVGIAGHPLVQEYLKTGKINFNNVSEASLDLAEKEFVEGTVWDAMYVARKTDGSWWLLYAYKNRIYDREFQRVLSNIGEPRIKELEKMAETILPWETKDERKLRWLQILVNEISSLPRDQRVGLEGIMLAYTYTLDEIGKKKEYTDRIKAQNKLIKWKEDNLIADIPPEEWYRIKRELLNKYSDRLVNASRENTDRFLTQDFVESNPDIKALANIMVKNDYGNMRLNSTAAWYTSSYINILKGLNEGKSFETLNTNYRWFKWVAWPAKILLAMQIGDHIDNRSDISDTRKQEFKESMLTNMVGDVAKIEDYRKIFWNDLADKMYAYWYGTANDWAKLFNEMYHDATQGNTSGKTRWGWGKAPKIATMKVDPLKLPKDTNGDNPFKWSDGSKLWGTAYERDGKFLDFNGEHFTTKAVALPGGFKSSLPFPVDSKTSQNKDIKRSKALKNRFKAPTK